MAELFHFDIRVLVEPGAFRTEGIYASIPGRELGDPDKIVEATVDVVRGKGVAKGRSWPDYLFLGDDAEAAARGKGSKLSKVLHEGRRYPNVSFPPSKIK